MPTLVGISVGLNWQSFKRELGAKLDEMLFPLLRHTRKKVSNSAAFLCGPSL